LSCNEGSYGVLKHFLFAFAIFTPFNSLMLIIKLNNLLHPKIDFFDL